MYAEFVLTIVVLQVADCIKLCLIRLDIVQCTLDLHTTLRDIVHNLGTIYVVFMSTRSKLVMSSVTFKPNLYL